MHSSGGSTRVAATVEDAEVVIGGWRTEEMVVWCVLPTGATRPNVDEKSGGGEGIRRKAWWHVGMKQEGADAIVEGADAIVEGAEDAFSATVLLRSVGTCETEDCAMSSEEGAKGEVIKLFSIIGLEGVDGSTKLGGDIGKERC
jgi:hypothetical protein